MNTSVLAAEGGHGETVLLSLAAILVLGIGAQWLAWRVRVPSILFLLLTGMIAGPFTGWLDPQAILGDLLFPIVSMSVGVILFEGGLSLKLSELKQIGAAVRNLNTIGALLTWVLCAIAAHYIVDLNWHLSLLLGAILVVSGPTVVLPLLRHVRPVGKTGSILKWEAILIDPVGATLAVLVYEVIAVTSGGNGGVIGAAAPVVLRTLVIGTVLGVGAAWIVVFFLRNYAVPDYLESAVVLMFVVMAFVGSNLLQTESGLLTVTVMGVWLANQKAVQIRQIVAFKENLRVLLISSLFILLAARLDLENLSKLDWRSGVFLAALILVVRPVTVFASTIGANLTFKERLFLAWVMPRLIVAAAFSSVCALRLLADDYAQSELLVPMTFLVIIGTVTIYGLTAGWLAKRLGLAHPSPQGLLLLGAGGLNRAISAALKEEGFRALLVDTNWTHVSAARMEGLPATYANILSESALHELDLGGIGRLLAMTPNEEVNSLAVMHFADLFGRSGLYQLDLKGKGGGKKDTAPDLKGRVLFKEGLTFGQLFGLYEAGGMIKGTQITEEFTFEEFKKKYGLFAVPMFIVTEAEELIVMSPDSKRIPKPGETLIALVNPLPT